MKLDIVVEDRDLKAALVNAGFDGDDPAQLHRAKNIVGGVFEERRVTNAAAEAAQGEIIKLLKEKEF